MRLRLAAVGAACALLCAAPAFADTTTTLGPGDRSPVVIAGSGVQRGDRLAAGEELLRRVTSVARGERRTIRITCPDQTVHGGLGLFEEARIGFAARNRYPGRRTAVVEVFPTRDADARGSIFALCLTPGR
jgi:hypothetical protein